jgi:hypothetical protein
MEEWMYNSTFSLFQLNLVVTLQLHTPPALLPKNETQVYFIQEAVWASEIVWTMWRSGNSSPYRDLKSCPSVVQPVASHFADYASATVY